jgi:hypothetical protein
MTCGLLPTKRSMFESLFLGGMVDVFLDARVVGVVVPPEHKHNASLKLVFGDNCHIPITDMQVTDDELSATLAFGDTTAFCVVPWQAVFGVSGQSGLGMVWEECVPVEVLSVLSETQAKA